MARSHTPAFIENPPNRRHAWYAVLFTFGILTTALVLALILSSGATGRWFTPPVLLFVIPVVGWIAGLVLMARGRFEWGVQLGLLVTLVALPLVSLYISGRGFVIGIAVGATALFVATLALPPSRAQWFIVLGVFAGLVAIVLDVFGSPSRAVLDSPILPGIIISVLLIGFLAVFVFLNFRSYPLRIKLLLAFVLLALLSVGSVTYVAAQAIRSSLTTNEARDLQTRAQAAALAVGIAVDRNLDRLSTLSLDKRIQDEVALVTDSYPAGEQERGDLIHANAGRWASAGPQERLIRNILDSESSYSLRQFGDVFQGNEEIFMTDAFGTVIAATAWRPQYNYSDQGWWQSAYNFGRGSIYVGQPVYEPMVNAYGVPMAVPIYAPGGTRAVGVLHSVFTMAALRRVLLLNSFGDSGKIDLLFPEGLLLTSEGNFRELTTDQFTQIKDGFNQTLPTLSYRDSPRLSSQGVVGVSDEQPEPYLRSSAWRTIATIEPAEALALVEAGTGAALLAGILAIAAAIVAALALAQFLTRPIRRLTLAVEQVQSGNLAARAPVESTDEIGALASAFNGMTARLQDTLSGLERRVAERTQELSEANLSLQSNSAYLSALSDTSTGLFERQSLNDLLLATVERAGALVGTQHGFVFFQEPAEQEIEMRVGSGLYDDLIGTRAQRGIGLAGTVWETGKPMVIDNYQKWEGRLPGSRRDALRAVVGVPLKRGAGSGSADDVTVGVIGLAYTEEGRVFGKAETDILQRFAQLASIALDNAGLYAASEYRLQELSALNTISQLMVSQNELPQVFDKVGEEIRRIFEADFGYLAIYNPDTQRIEFPYAVDNNVRIEIAPIPLGEGITSQVMTSGEALLIAHGTDQDYQRVGAKDAGDGQSPNSLLTVPIRVGASSVGAISVQRIALERPFVSDDLKLLTTIATNIGVALDNVRLAQDTRRRVLELSSLNRISAIVTSDKPLDERMGLVGQELHGIFNVTGVYVALYDPATNMVRMPFFMGDNEIFQIEPYALGPGFTSHVIQTRAPLLINTDIREQIERLQAMDAGDGDLNESYLGMPILLGDRVFGVIGLSDMAANKFSESDMNLLSTIGSTIASSIQNARLFEQTQNALSQTAYQAQRLGILNQLSAELNRVQDVNALYAVAAAGTRELFRESDATFAMLTANPGMVRLHALQDPTAARFVNVDLTIENTLIEQSLHEQRILNIPDLRAITFVDSATMVSQGLASCMIVPLFAAANQPLGTLNIVSPVPERFAALDEQLASQIGNLISAAIQNRRLFEQSRAALAETERLAAQARQSAEQVSALNRRLTREGWQDYIKIASTALAAEAVREHAAENNANGASSNGKGASEADREQAGRIQIPIIVRGEEIGSIEMDYDDADGEWSEDKQAIVNNIGEKLGLVLDNARLQGQMQAALEETRRLAERERKAAEIANRIYATTDVKQLLQIATEELRRSTGSARAVVKLSRDKPNT